MIFSQQKPRRSTAAVDVYQHFINDYPVFFLLVDFTLHFLADFPFVLLTSTDFPLKYKSPLGKLLISKKRQWPTAFNLVTVWLITIIPCSFKYDSGKIQTRKTLNTDTFYAVNDKKSQKFLRNNFEIQKQTNLLLN